LDLLSEFAAYQANGAHATDREHIRLLELRQQLSDRLLLVSFEIRSVTAEAACEEARAAHVAERLQKVQDKKVHTQTLVAIVGEAMIGIVAGGLSLAGAGVAAATMDIAGASFSTGFGLAAFIEKETHQFQHRRNLLREVWEGPEHSKLFPASVWKYLTTAIEDTPTLRERVWSRTGAKIVPWARLALRPNGSASRSSLVMVASIPLMTSEHRRNCLSPFEPRST
jgi:hypothetical protein